MGRSHGFIMPRATGRVWPGPRNGPCLTLMVAAGYAAPMPSSSLSLVPAGTLVVIGGAEDKIGRSRVLARFVELAGGPQARIAVCATASSLGPEVARLYDTVFQGLGAAEVVSVSPRTREEADDPGLAAVLGQVSAVFFSGGNQMKLSQTITGTAFGDAIRALHLDGRTVAGTSAGASVMSEHMIAFGAAGATPKNRIAQLARGLGLLSEVVVDQHFDQRNRHGRLLTLVAQSPSLLGLGVDEDTAAVVSGGRVLEVIGRGSVFLVDGGRAITSAASASRSQPLLVSGAILHVLPAGSRFDLVDRRLMDVVAGTHPGEAVDLVATAADVRRVAARRAKRKTDQAT